MKYGTISYNGMTLKPVNLSVAKNAYSLGLTVYFAPCKANLNHIFNHLGSTNTLNDESFDSVINSFRYYNCNNEMGLYPVFFVNVNEKPTLEKILESVDCGGFNALYGYQNRFSIFLKHTQQRIRRALNKYGYTVSFLQSNSYIMTIKEKSMLKNELVNYY